MSFCTSSMMHPYECSHDKFCEHCTWAVFKGHNPKKCALCQDVGQLVKEPFATRIYVKDYSHRKQRLKFDRVDNLIFNLPVITRQQGLPL